MSTHATEQQAKTRWCPFVRASSGETDNNASNRVIRSDDSPPKLHAWNVCIGSACMAWRSSEEMSTKDGVLHSGHVKDGEPVYAGYCGLAGKP